MNHGKDFVVTQLCKYLDRWTMPRSLEGKPEAQREEVNALVAHLLRHAPSQGYEDWWEKVKTSLEQQARTRAWPTTGEIYNAVKAVRGPQHVSVSQGNEIDTINVMINRMNEGQPVGENAIFGRAALAIEKSGRVSLAIMTTYRESLKAKNEKVYGKDIAEIKHSEMLERHEAAKAPEDATYQYQDAKIPHPKRLRRYDWDG